MSEWLYSDNVLVFVDADGPEVAAHFLWDESPPEDTFTLEAEPGITLELDAHFPVRPSVIRIAKAAQASEEQIARYTGEHLAEYVGTDRLSGMFTVHTALDPTTRFAIAQLEADSSEAPDLLRDACRAMIDEHERAALA
jgi:hypothetical protein